MADQPLVVLAGEQGDLGFAEVMAEGAAGGADLLAAAGDQQGRIQLGPEGGAVPCRSGAIAFGPTAEGLGEWGPMGVF